MKRLSLFGSHLYNQIVVPLLAASLIVGLVATAVAVYFLRDLTDKWVSQVADGTTTNLVVRYTQYADEMKQISRVIASDPQLRDAVAKGDKYTAAERITWAKSTLGYDNLMILDAEGKVVASSGFSAIQSGTRPLDASADAFGRISGDTELLISIGGVETLTTLHPMVLPGGTYIMVLSRVMSDAFLEQLAGETGSAFCLYTAEKKRVACTVSAGLGGREGADLRSTLDSGNKGVNAALAKVTSDTAGVSELRVDSTRYEVWARRIVLQADSDPLHAGYLVGVVSQRVSDQASRTTTNLIAMWSIVAVVALVGLGGWVARRVSDPLVELSEVARNIADGDFSRSVHIEGENEIASLAIAFNDMQTSLKERSESLTKKVLELATLYEMSRSLGSTLDLDELLGSVLDSALRIFDLDLGYVSLREKESGSLLVRAVRGAVSAGATDGAVRSSMAEWVVREGRPLIFNPDTSASGTNVDTVTGAKAALCVPLVSSEGTIGSITVGSSDISYRFNSDDVRLLSTIANHVTIAVGNIELFTSLQEAYLATVRSLAAAVDAKDTYTRGHSDRVATYATLIAERMGLSHEQRIALEMAAYLHDIGKIGVKEEILLKPGRLDDDEMAQMRHHPLIGANILKPVAFPWAITPVVRHHHEHYDGSGYPAGLKGEEIPLLARILTVADSYEAMTADRPYRKGRDPLTALEELRRCAGTQFDARVVERFGEIIEESERAGAGVLFDNAEEPAPEEARAIFSALVDGVFASFRRLGGPRLASNVEVEVDKYLAETDTPFRIVSGKISFTRPPAEGDEEIEQMRTVLRRMDATMGRLSGSTLVDHFYTDALETFSGRMRALAADLDFYTG